MIERITKALKEKPEEHMIFLLTVVSFTIGICVWQYCKGYYNTIGIWLKSNLISTNNVLNSTS